MLTLKNKKLCYSYVMGMKDEIFSLKEQGFTVCRDGENYTVTFPKESAPLWEAFVSSHLPRDYWNEYLADGRVVFLFSLEAGIKRVVVEADSHPEVLSLCEALCGCEFPSLQEMLLGNWFYRQAIGGTP